MNGKEVRKYLIGGQSIPPKGYAAFLTQAITAYRRYIKLQCDKGEHTGALPPEVQVTSSEEDVKEGEAGGISIEIHARLEFNRECEPRQLRTIRTLTTKEEWLLDTSREMPIITEENYKRLVPQITDRFGALLDERYPKREGKLPVEWIMNPPVTDNPYEKTRDFEYTLQLAPALESGFFDVARARITLTSDGLISNESGAWAAPGIEIETGSWFGKREGIRDLGGLLGEIVEHHYKVGYTKKTISSDNLDKKIKEP